MDDWVHAIANETVNVNNSESCIANASKAIDAMYKAYEIARANCFKVFDASNAAFLSAKGPVAAFINNNAALPATLLLNGIAECFKINQLADAKALAASTNCTKTAFAICVDQV